DAARRAELVTQLREAGHRVLVVGQSPGDDAALSRADLALSQDWTPAARGIRLADLDLHWVVRALQLCRAMRRSLRVDRVLALLAMLLPLPFCAAGLLPAWGVALVVALAALTVAVTSWLISSRGHA